VGKYLVFHFCGNVQKVSNNWPTLRTRDRLSERFLLCYLFEEPEGEYRQSDVDGLSYERHDEEERVKVHEERPREAEGADYI